VVPSAGRPAALHVEEWKDSAGRPVRLLAAGVAHDGAPEVVLLPGLGAVGYLLDVLHAAAAWTRASLLDVPGFGRHETADCPVDLDSLTAVTLGALPARPAVVLGHSTGAQLALRVAVTAPDRVAALVLVGPTFEPAARRLSSVIARLMRTSMREPPGQLRYTVPDYLRGGRQLVGYLREALRDRPEQRVGQVRCPVIVARGQHDGFCSQEWVDRLARQAPADESTTLRGAHNVPYAHPGAVALLLGEARRRCSHRTETSS
jgi:pimeloyl-ACP methyl ester carboxylesterase